MKKHHSCYDFFKLNISAVTTTPPTHIIKAMHTKTAVLVFFVTFILLMLFTFTPQAVANAPDLPSATYVVPSETAPTSCPSSAPAGTFPANTNVKVLCETAFAAAPSGVAAAAVRYMFSHLGAEYSQGKRYSTTPPIFDCSSFVARGYNAAGGVIIRSNGTAVRWSDMFGWTGAYMPSTYQNTNLQRLNVSKGNISQLVPGDVLIQFDGANPSNSVGNNGHAQVYIGNGLVIQSGGNHPKSLVNVTKHHNSFDNEWYFRYSPSANLDPVHAKWVSLGGMNSVVGTPVAPPFSNAKGGITRYYQSGHIFWSQATGAKVVYGGVLGRYVALGAERSPLGLPTTDEVDMGVPGSRGNFFQGGTILWSGPTGAHPVWGGIYARYERLGGEKSFLRLPVSGELPGPLLGSVRQNFQGGTILWSPSSGAWEVGGGIGVRYWLGNNVTLLGLPISGEYTPAGSPSVRVQDFQKGKILWSPSTGAWPVQGGISWVYFYVGGHKSSLGLPTSGEMLVPGGVEQKFENGIILWSPETDVRFVVEPIFNTFQKLGGLQRLGFPTSHPVLVNGGTYQQYQRGVIYVRNNIPHAVLDSVAARYIQIGAKDGVLGLPTLSEVTSRRGGTTVQSFQRGKVWRTGNSAYEVYGGIGFTYASLGEEGGVLGAPTSGEMNGPVPNSRMNLFQNGSIIWTPERGAHHMQGAIWERYQKANLGVIIGAPVEPEKVSKVAGVKVQKFQRGIMWSSASGAWEVYGGILATYNAVGAENSHLGVPTSGEQPSFLPGSRMSLFKNGALLWSGPTGAHPVQGAMWEAYLAGKLYDNVGLPVEVSRGGGVPGVAWQRFQKGTMFWSQSTGAYALQGRISDAYLYIGAAKSSLGLPISKQYNVPGGVAVNFQKGTIAHNLTTDQFTITQNQNKPQPPPAPNPVPTLGKLVHPRTGQEFPPLVIRWKDVTSQVLKDLKIEQHYLPGVLAQIQQESSGIPDIANNWDINWEKGYASFGLLQTIAPTYQKYAPPGASGVIGVKDVKGKPQQFIPEMVIPYNNIYAGVNYAVSRYGKGKLDDWNRGENKAYMLPPE